MIKSEALTIIKNWLQNNNFYYNDGIKYGIDLLIYTESPYLVHSKFGLILYDGKISYRELIALQRTCNASKKVLLITKINDKNIPEFIRVDKLI